MCFREHSLVIQGAPVTQVCLLDRLGSLVGTHPHAGHDFRIQGGESLEQACTPDGEEVHTASLTASRLQKSIVAASTFLPGLTFSP
jgi:hypothetical protein